MKKRKNYYLKEINTKGKRPNRDLLSLLLRYKLLSLLSPTNRFFHSLHLIVDLFLLWLLLQVLCHSIEMVCTSFVHHSNHLVEGKVQWHETADCILTLAYIFVFCLLFFFLFLFLVRVHLIPSLYYLLSPWMLIYLFVCMRLRVYVWPVCNCMWWCQCKRLVKFCLTSISSKKKSFDSLFFSFRFFAFICLFLVCNRYYDKRAFLWKQQL